VKPKSPRPALALKTDSFDIYELMLKAHVDFGVDGTEAEHLGRSNNSQMFILALMTVKMSSSQASNHSDTSKCNAKGSGEAFPSLAKITAVSCSGAQITKLQSTNAIIKWFLLSSLLVVNEAREEN
jgi:hypothetical protein